MVGLCVCAWGLDIENLMNTSLIYCVPYFNLFQPITTLFLQPRQNPYLIRALEFGYNGFGYIVT